MALRLNLYHEIDKQKALNRRDPLKLSIMGLIVVAVGFAGFYVYELSVEHSLSSDLASRKALADKLQPQSDVAAKTEQALQESIKLSEALVKRVEGRFYWASVLDGLVQIVPREIQVTKMAGEVSSDKAKKCNITLEGLSAGTEPRKVAEDLRRALTEKFATKYKNVSATFKTLEDGREAARLDGQHLPTAIFAINLQMQAGEDEVAAPPPKKFVGKKPADQAL